MTLYIGNDNLIKVTGLYDSVASAYANTATVTWELTHDGGSAIASGVLAYVANSRGDYQGIIEEDVALHEDQHFHLKITADAGSDRIAYWDTPVTIASRTA